MASSPGTPTPADIRPRARTAPTEPDPQPVTYEPIRPTERSCCCPAEPVVRVVLPPSETRAGETDLLFCAHHFRRSRAALEAAHATVFDATGALAKDTQALFAASPGTAGE